MLGVVVGLFFASYLVKLGRLGGKKPSKQGLPPSKEFAEIIKRQNSEAASQRTGSTQSGSDHNNGNDETDKFL